MKACFITRAASISGIIAAALGASNATAQQLWTVDDNGPADFTVIQDAVNSVANGDVILVRPGSYAGFQIVGKGLAVIGDPSTAPTLSSAIGVAQTAANQVVVLAGFAQYIPVFGTTPGLAVQSCAGVVHVEGCSFRGQDAPPAGTYGSPGLRVDQSPGVFVSASTATGGSGYEGYSSTPYGGGDGATVSASQLALFQADCFAGVPATSHTPFNLFGFMGGSGVRADGSLLFSSHARMQGGQGGKHSMTSQQCAQSNGGGECGDGGHGLWLVGAASNVNVQQPDLVAGAGGTSNCFSGLFYLNGEPGKPFRREAPGSLARRVNGERRTMTAPAFVAGTTSFAVTVTGVAGDLVYFVFEPTPHFQYDATLHGVWSLSYPPTLPSVPAAVIGGTGSVTFGVTLPAIPVGQEAQTHFLQPYVVDLGGQTFVGTPRSVTLAQ